MSFKSYALSNLPKGFNISLVKLESKHKSWKENGWRDGNDKEIKNWKSKLNNTIPYLGEDKKTSSKFYW